jgi:hypothetical protein
MNKQKKLSPMLLIGGLIIFLFLVPSSLSAQISRALDVGNMWYSTGEWHHLEDLTYPRDWVGIYSIYNGNLTHNNLDMLQMGRIIVGIDKVWTDLDGTTWNKMISEASETKGADATARYVAVAGAFKREYRNPYPTKILDGKNWTDTQGQGDPINPNCPSDVLIYMKNQVWPAYGGDMDVERWVYSFVNQEYGDIVLLEYLFTNTASTTQNGCYFAFTSETNSHAQYPGDLWGNYYGVTYHKYVEGDQTADSLRLWYSWDADNASIPEDTRGNPNNLWGHFLEPQCMSFVVVHVDKSTSDESNDPAQPIKAGWSQRELNPDLKNESQEGMYNFITQPWVVGNAWPYSKFVDADGNEVAAGTGMYRVLKEGIDLDNFDSNQEQEKSGTLSFGPYTMGPGEDVRIVLAYAGGTIPLGLAISAGRAYANGYSSQLELVPLPENVYDLEGNLIASAGSTLDKDTKDAILDLSIDYAFKNASKAIKVWQNGTVRKGTGSFNISMAPPSPSLTGTSENDQIRLQWGNEAETGPNGGNISGYRLYRNYFRPPSITSPTDTDFVKISNFPVGTFEFVDNINNGLVRGEDYYYYLTAISNEDVESSKWLNRTGTSANREDQALSPTRGPDPDWENRVVVVPNPFHASAAKKYGGRRLNFFNLPPYANIHIYTQTGDLVQTIEHDSNTGDKDWEKQNTFNTTEIVSGLYIFVVEELDGPRGSTTGKKFIGKFVVIK